MCGILGCATGALVTVVRAHRGQREMADGETAVHRLTELALRLDRSGGRAGGLANFPSLRNVNATTSAIVNNRSLDNEDDTGEAAEEIGEGTKTLLPEGGIKEVRDTIDALLGTSAK
ncbi:hypothetical protein MRX96_018138 [Rhipicephalus microplus]